jgi:hypothetical protein
MLFTVYDNNGKKLERTSGLVRPGLPAERPTRPMALLSLLVCIRDRPGKPGIIRVMALTDNKMTLDIYILGWANAGEDDVLAKQFIDDVGNRTSILISGLHTDTAQGVER